MTGPASAHDDAQKVWRYLSFSRFVWLLQNKRLWLSRLDCLADPWEGALAGEQLEHVVSRHPPPPFPFPAPFPETALARAARITTIWRQTTFVSCWSVSEHESHALWRIYCGHTEGVAIQTTFGRLRQSVGGLPVYRIDYEIPGTRRQTPTRFDLVTKKRPMFKYEQEVRIVLEVDEKVEEPLLGHRLDWDAEKNAELIRVHPEADCSFMETVRAVVDHYAPALREHIAWSAMKAHPPLQSADPRGTVG